MRTTLEILRERSDEIHAVAQRHGAHSLRLFGSVARGSESSTSDVDLLVEFERGRSLFDHAALRVELSDLLGRPVDIVSEDSLHRLLRRKILDQAIAL